MQWKTLAILFCTWIALFLPGRTLSAEAAETAEDPSRGLDDDPIAAAELDQAARIDALIEDLGSERREVRDAAESELARLSTAARSGLERAAADRNPQIAVRAARLLDKLPRLTHAVVDALGAPIAGATVTVTIASHRDVEFALEESITVQSDEHGRIHVPPLPSPESRVVVDLSHSKYGAGSYELNSHDREDLLRFPLVAAGSEARRRALKGIVLRPNGKPIAGALLRCRSVRTPGQGLVNPSYPYGEAVTDERGRFSYYLPNENRNRERGELIPVNSNYNVTITVPHDETMFPTAGEFSNLEPNTITLRHAARFHAFRFEAADGGWIEDPQQLQKISIVFWGDAPDYSERVTLEPFVVTKGRHLIPGRYAAEGYFGGAGVSFEPVEVTRDSPAYLEFRLPPEITFRGRVVHGVTGEPLAGAFVVGWSSTSRQNLALLSINDWHGLRKLEPNPPLDHPSIKLLQEHYGVQGLVRTDDDGRFEITQARDQEFYGLMAFAEDYVPFKVRSFSLDTRGPGQVEAGEFALFPAAKVVVRPIHEGGQLSVSPKWLLADEGQPPWIDRFHSATDGHNREFEYVHWLRLNEPQPLYVPAGVRLRLMFETPYNDEWAPSSFETPIQLDQGESHEIGELHFAAALPAIVRVLDQDGQPVEGVPVRRKYDDGDAWCVAHNTDATGQAYFHVNPSSQGIFRVSDVRGPREVAMAKNLLADFEVADAAPEQPFEITITDEQKRMLLDTANERPR